MPKFQTTSDQLQLPLPQEIAEALLVEAGTANELPTSESKLMQFLGLQQLSFDFMHELDFVPQAAGAPVEIRAALSLNDRLVATQAGLSSKRKRWGMFHEIAHFILPEHRDKLFFVDSDATLSWWTRARIEREANEIAAELLFQGSRFTEEALSAPTSVRTPIDLAPRYGASFESAFRRYTERHVIPCALIVFDKVARELDDGEPEDAEYKIHYTITSPSFRKNYFSALQVKDGSTVKGTELLKKKVWWAPQDVIEAEFSVARGGNEKPWHFHSEIFTNSYKVFQFVLPPKESLK